MVIAQSQARIGGPFASRLANQETEQVRTKPLSVQAGPTLFSLFMIARKLAPKCLLGLQNTRDLLQAMFEQVFPVDALHMVCAA